MIELLVVIAIIGILAALLLPAIASALDRGRSAVCVSNPKQIGVAIIAYADENRGYLPPAQYRDACSGVEAEGWPTLLVAGGFLNAPWSTSATDIPATSVFRCPSGRDAAPAVTGLGYTDPAYGGPNAFRSAFKNAYQLTWYGIYGGTGAGGCFTCATRWPFQRWPHDDCNKNTQLYKIDRQQDPAGTIVIYDGWWMHNGALVNGNHVRGVHARHGRGTTANFLFLDGHVQAIKCVTLNRDSTTVPKFRW